MKNGLLIFTISLMITGTAISYAQKKQGTVGPEYFQHINWEEFDKKNSTIAKNKIKESDLQGAWAAYAGAIYIMGSATTMKLTQPITIEFKNRTFRRSAQDTFQPYAIKSNWIISNDKEDIGVINQITPRDLTISWKNGANYTRYYYMQ